MAWPFGNLSAMTIEPLLDPSHNSKVRVVAGSHVNDGMVGKGHTPKITKYINIFWMNENKGDPSKNRYQIKLKTLK